LFGNADYTYPQLVIGNHITDSTGWGIDCGYDGTAQLAGIFIANRTRDNASGAINGFDDWATGTSIGHVTTDTGGPETDYTDAGSNDYTLISAAPAKGVGLVPYMDIGGLQRQEPAGGGGMLQGNLRGNMQ
jgi:hypothetical protein